MTNTTSVTLNNIQEGAQAPSLPLTPANTENAPHLSPAAGNAIALPHTVAEWQKNSRESFRVSLAEYKGKALVDCRVFYRADDRSLKPSPKGISAELKHLTAFAKGVADALEIARHHGLVEGGDQ